METIAWAPPAQAGPPGRVKLASGWRAFDDLDLVRPGRVTLLDVGSESGMRLVCRLLAEAVARVGEAVVLDGGNWMDVYRLGDCAEAAGHSRLATLLGVRVARGFTAYQLQALIEDAMPRVVAEGGASVGLVVVPSFPEMYLDEDLRPDEANVLAGRALDACRDVAVEHDVPVVVTNSTLPPGARHRLRATLEARADVVVGLFPAARGGPGLRIVAPQGSFLAPAPGAKQRLLGDFAPSAAPGGRFVRHAPDARYHLVSRGAGWVPPSQTLRHLPKRAGELRHRQKARADAVVVAPRGEA